MPLDVRGLDDVDDERQLFSLTRGDYAEDGGRDDGQRCGFARGDYSRSHGW